MVRAFLRLSAGLLSLAPFWRLFVLALLVVNGVAPLFYLDAFLGRMVLLSLMTSTLFMTFLTQRFGFARILGLAHVAWLPMLVVAFLSLPAFPMSTSFGLWLRVLLLLDSFALVFDTWDVVRFLRGDKAEMVPALDDHYVLKRFRA